MNVEPWQPFDYQTSALTNWTIAAESGRIRLNCASHVERKFQSESFSSLFIIAFVALNKTSIEKAKNFLFCIFLSMIVIRFFSGDNKKKKTFYRFCFSRL